MNTDSSTSTPLQAPGDLGSSGGVNFWLALVLVGIATICYSSTPTIMKWGKAEDAPIFFAFILVAVQTGLCVILLRMLGGRDGVRQTVERKDVIEFIRAEFGYLILLLQKSSHLRKLPIMRKLSIAEVDSLSAQQIEGERKSIKGRGSGLRLTLLHALSRLNLLFFALSILCIPVSLATIVMETWPVWLCWLLLAYRSAEKSRQVPTESGVSRATLRGASALCVVGLSICIVGQSTNFGADWVLHGAAWQQLLSGPDLWMRTLGAVLGMVAAVLTALSPASSIQFSNILRQKFGDREVGAKHASAKRVIFFELIPYAAGGSITALVLLVPWVAALLFGGAVDAVTWSSAIISACVILLGAICLRIAYYLYSDESINLLYFVTPVIALLWLQNFGYVEIEMWDSMVIGLGAIITGNLMCRFSVDNSWAFKGLVGSIWLFGYIVYLRNAIPFDPYLAMLGATITVFILLFSFRTTRIMRRVHDEERDFLELWEDVSAQASARNLDDARRALSQIDSQVSPAQLSRSYRQLQDQLPRSDENYENSKLREMWAKINKLVLSKQLPMNYGELISIGILGFVAVCGLLLFQPEKVYQAPVIELSIGEYAMRVGLAGLFVEAVAILLASTVVFLFCSLLDLQMDRRTATMDDQQRLFFRDARSRETLASVVTLIGLMLSYLWLLLDKWSA